MKTISLAAILALALLSSADRPASATLVKFEFTGKITHKHQLLFSFFEVGDPWFISFTVDDNSPDQDVADLTVGVYIGTSTFRLGFIDVTGVGTKALIRNLDFVDLIQIDFFGTTYSGETGGFDLLDMTLGLSDVTGTALTNDSLSNLLNLDRSLFATEEMFSRFDTHTAPTPTTMTTQTVEMRPPATFDSVTITVLEVPDPTIDDTCDIGSGPNDIETVTASYDEVDDEIVVEMALCADADKKTRYRVFFDHQDTTDLDGDGMDDGPDTLDPNPDCVSTYDDRMIHKGRRDRGPGTIEVDGDVLTYSVDVDDLNPGLELGDTVLIWADTKRKTKRKNVIDRAPNTETGDECAKPEVANEVLSLELN